MLRPGQRARAGKGWSVGSVVSHSQAPRQEGWPSIAQEFRDIGHDGTDVRLGQLALPAVIALDLVPVPQEDRDIRVLGDLVVGGPVGALADGQRDVLDAGLLSHGNERAELTPWRAI